MLTRSPYATALRAAREAAGLMQSELAARVGVHRALVNAVECDKRHAFHVSRTLELAGFMGKAVDAFHLAALAAKERGIDPKMLTECSIGAIRVLISLVIKLPGLSEAKLETLNKLIDGL